MSTEITLRQALILTGCLERDGEKVSGKYKDLVYIRKENGYGSEMYGINEAMKKFDPDNTLVTQIRPHHRYVPGDYPEFDGMIYVIK